ncbi:hypothetical protein FRC17_010695 [Serendipita sp. 399]|nr:hypothetical protein FRC17_010695 [Serendipita sp. 399]
MVFGPFVNDALWEVSKLGTGEVVKNSEACTVKGLETEADLVSARWVLNSLLGDLGQLNLVDRDRLLAYAGFDAHAAVKFWEEREAKDMCAEAQRKAKPVEGTDRPSEPGFFSRITEWLPLGREVHGAGRYFEKTPDTEKGVHPISAERVKKLRAELERWDTERARHLLALAKEKNLQVAAATTS